MSTNLSRVIICGHTNNEWRKRRVVISRNTTRKKIPYHQSRNDGYRFFFFLSEGRGTKRVFVFFSIDFYGTRDNNCYSWRVLWDVQQVGKIDYAGETYCFILLHANGVRDRWNIKIPGQTIRFLCQILCVCQICWQYAVLFDAFVEQLTTCLMGISIEGGIFDRVIKYKIIKQTSHHEEGENRN